MYRDEARRVLERIAVVRDKCDLDLLIFFVLHPRALLASEQLAAFVGYELPRISASLDTLIGARLLTRAQSPNHAARLYVFTPDQIGGDWLPSLTRLASTREGRLALKEALRRDAEGTGNAATPIARARMIARIG